MSKASRKWKLGSASRCNLNYHDYIWTQPDQFQRIDKVGVYHERKRLKSKYYGVHWKQRRGPNGEWLEGRWEVSVQLNGEKYYGGRFREEFEVQAADAYDKLIRRLGINAPLNFPSGMNS